MGGLHQSGVSASALGLAADTIDAAAGSDRIEELLRCPRTGAPLLRLPDGSLGTFDGQHVYPAVHGVPILIDGERSVLGDTAFSNDARSPIERGSPRARRGFLKRMLSPEKASTRDNIAAFVDLVKARKARPLVLVIGGGTPGQGTERLFEDEQIRIVTLDIYLTENVTFVADAHQLPLPDASVDGLVVQAVLEHVLEPDRVVAEIWRVLGDGGLVYAETPFLQQVHEGAYDFTRFTDSGHRYLFRRFSQIRAGLSGGPGTQLLWSIDYFVRGLFRSRLAGKIAKLTFFWLQYFDRAIPERHALDSASGTYFLGSKSDRAMSPREAIAYYRGAQ